MKLTIRQGSSYWSGSLSDVVRWAKEPTYNDLQRRRQQAALGWLAQQGLSV